MDSDCLIGFEPHPTSQCPERLPQNCPNFHVFIKNYSDHTAVCAMKTWLYIAYPQLYATPPLERFIVGCKTPIRYLNGGIWKKPMDRNELFSAECGILIRFKSENDFAVLTNKFAPIRIAFVVKENSNFVVKLMLLSSKQRFMVAPHVNEHFNRVTAAKSHQWKTTLIVAVTSIEDLCFDVMTLPPREMVKTFTLRYDKSTAKFDIPQDLEIGTLMPSDNQKVNRQPNNQLMLPQVRLEKSL